jgi:hypothetical protein
MGRGEVYTGCWWENLRERNHWDDPDADARITVRWILRKKDGLPGSGYGQLAGSCNRGDEPSGSVKCDEILDQRKVGWTDSLLNFF